MPIDVLTVFGTRPEAIKMAPVVVELNKDNNFNAKVCITAQHRQMLDQVLDLFDITPDYDLNIMAPGQDLPGLTAKILVGMRNIFSKYQPDIVLVHGDTTTCFAAGLAAFYEQIQIGHIEAGLRTGNLLSPFPEEANRILIDKLANYHFAPTQTALNNLINENIPRDNIVVTGNTVIDALLMIKDRIQTYPDIFWYKQYGSLYDSIIDNNRKFILITGHRRENFGKGLLNLCSAIKEIALEHSDWDFVYPVHMNPNVQEPVNNMLGNLENVYLIAPQKYDSFVWLMSKCDLIVTDSGGIQEEGPVLGKPIVVTRNITERPEAIGVGAVILAGTKQKDIVETIEKILLRKDIYEKMSRHNNIYGDGYASLTIKNFLYNHIKQSNNK